MKSTKKSAPRTSSFWTPIKMNSKQNKTKSNSPTSTPWSIKPHQGFIATQKPYKSHSAKPSTSTPLFNFGKVKKKDLTYPQAKALFPSLNPYGDADKDGVKNWLDCRPFDPSRQDEPKTKPESNPILKKKLQSISKKLTDKDLRNYYKSVGYGDKQAKWAVGQVRNNSVKDLEGVEQWKERMKPSKEKAFERVKAAAELRRKISLERPRRMRTIGDAIQLQLTQEELKEAHKSSKKGLKGVKITNEKIKRLFGDSKDMFLKEHARTPKNAYEKKLVDEGAILLDDENTWPKEMKDEADKQMIDDFDKYGPDGSEDMWSDTLNHIEHETENNVVKEPKEQSPSEDVVEDMIEKEKDKDDV